MANIVNIDSRIKWMNSNCEKDFRFICELELPDEYPTTQAIPTLPPKVECDFGFKGDDKFYLNPYDETKEYCYSFPELLQSWDEATMYCEGKGARLASVSNQMENDFFLNQIQGSISLWIGFSRVDGQFQWVDGNSAGFYNWNEGGKLNETLDA